MLLQEITERLPSEDQVEEFMNAGREGFSLFKDLPAAPELVCILSFLDQDLTNAPREIRDNGRLFHSALEDFHSQVAWLAKDNDMSTVEGGMEGKAACLVLLETLNSALNNIISTPRLEGGPRDSSPPTPAEPPAEPPADPPVLLPTQPALPDGTPLTQTLPPAAGVPGPTFNRTVSREENDTFIAIFQNVKATPRKIKRVVNV